MTSRTPQWPLHYLQSSYKLIGLFLQIFLYSKAGQRNTETMGIEEGKGASFQGLVEASCLSKIKYSNTVSCECCWDRDNRRLTQWLSGLKVLEVLPNNLRSVPRTYVM